MIIYFTGTGNSKYAADLLGELLEDEVLCANDYIRNRQRLQLTSEKAWVFVFPVYISTMAKPFADFLMKSSLQGCRDAYFAATCASEAGSSANCCMEICRKQSLHYKGIVKVQMPQNYIALFTMTPDEECQRRWNAAEITLREAAVRMTKGELLDMHGTSGMEYRMVQLVERLYYGPFTRTRAFYATDACVGCGLCEKVCPLSRIRMKDGRPQWSGSCVHCMACINRCPRKAIEYGRRTRGKSRYVCKTYHSK